MLKKFVVAIAGMVLLGHCIAAGDAITQCQEREWERYTRQGYSRAEIKVLLPYITEQCVEDN